MRRDGKSEHGAGYISACGTVCTWRASKAVLEAVHPRTTTLRDIRRSHQPESTQGGERCCISCCKSGNCQYADGAVHGSDFSFARSFERSARPLWVPVSHEASTTFELSQCRASVELQSRETFGGAKRLIAYIPPIDGQCCQLMRHRGIDGMYLPLYISWIRTIPLSVRCIRTCGSTPRH
ncbi:hypothetical protein PENSPDRAFT_86405 [Peniophora sp. CONT]|nr:hypothetical protein PENSPDRAFT_86405 [Peniophora sp. CONT]